MWLVRLYNRSLGGQNWDGPEREPKRNRTLTLAAKQEGGQDPWQESGVAHRSRRAKPSLRVRAGSSECPTPNRPRRRMVPPAVEGRVCSVDGRRR